ncbi:MAG: alpha/beta fold hydrolase [Opitutaceae bacterium]|nr:alpha/beta fold hydrolase [Opitutaceae bacterium]
MPHLFHRTFGEPSDLVVILLHGLLGSSRNWLTTAGELASERRVHALDLRNHGQSFHDDRMDYPSMARDVIAWMDEAGLDSALIVGHSMGGKVAMKLSEDFPRRVKGVGVVDIAPRDYQSFAHRAEFAAMNALDLRTIASRAEAELRFEGLVPDWAMRKFLTTNLERSDDGWRWVINLPVLTRALPQLEADPLGETSTYRGPIRFWRGTRSAYIRPEDERRIISLYPQARVDAIEGAGHNPHMDSRPALVAALRDYAASVA